MSCRTLAILFILLFASYTNASCPPGSFSDPAGDCRLCPKGFAQPLPGQSGCNQCPSNSFTPVEGAVNCSPCASNEIATPTLDSCQCPPGYIYGEANANGDYACEACPPGTLNRRGGAPFPFNYCDACAANTFSSEAGQIECQPCPEGQVSPQGASSCFACEGGEEVVDGECTSCAEGFTYDNSLGSCKACEPGFFKPAAGNYPCIPCPPLTTSNGSATECFTPCEAGKALMRDGSCRSCTAGNYYDFDEGICAPCPYDSFMPHANIRTECYRCAGDSHSPRGAASCTCRGELLNDKCLVCDPLPDEW